MRLSGTCALRWVFLALPVCFITTGRADEIADAKVAQSVVRAFNATCLQSLPHLEKVEASAKYFNWQELNGTEGTLLAPQDPSAKFKGWFVKDAADVPVFLGISRAVKDGRQVYSYSIATSMALAKPTISALKEFLTLGDPLDSWTEGGQRYTGWETVFSDRHVLITVIDATPSKYDSFVNLGATIKE